jgi:dTDP-glucose 4,6-dehydratase
MDTILVTGGAGFLGSWFVRQWLAEERGQVVVLDKLTYAGSRASLAEVGNHSRLTFRRGDIADRTVVSALLADFQPRAIVNFAAETHVDRSIDAPAPFVATNVVGTAELLEATLSFWRQLTGDARDHFRFLHVSTDEVYGPIDAPHRAAESAPYRPSSPYAASKAAADHLVRAYYHTYGLPVLLVHPANCYGPFQFPEKLVPLAILNAADGRSIPLYGDGGQQRDWLFADDLCRAVRLVLDRGTPGESFNVAANVEQTNLTLVRAICAAVDKQVSDPSRLPSRELIVHVVDRPGHDRRYALDTSKIRHLGWTPRIDFSTGLATTVQWYLENRAWVAEVAADFDRTHRLGLGSP